MRRRDELEMRQQRRQEVDQLPAPDRVQMQVEFVDQQHAARGERVLAIGEGLGDAVEQVAAPGGHVLVAVGQLAQGHLAVDGVEHQLARGLVDAREIHAPHQLVERRADRRQRAGAAPVVEVHRPALQRDQRGVGREHRGQRPRARRACAVVQRRAQAFAAFGRPARHAVAQHEVVAVGMPDRRIQRVQRPRVALEDVAQAVATVQLQRDLARLALGRHQRAGDAALPRAVADPGIGVAEQLRQGVAARQQQADRAQHRALAAAVLAEQQRPAPVRAGGCLRADAEVDRQRLHRAHIGQRDAGQVHGTGLSVAERDFNGL